MTHTLVVTQPYVPQYRVPLFDSIAEKLRSIDSELLVLHGQPGQAQARRQDALTVGVPRDWSAPIAERTIRGSRGRLLLRSLPDPNGEPAVLVTELSAANNLAWRYAMSRRTSCILWGHGRTYTHSPSRASAAAKIRLVKMADRTMLYSPGGSRYLSAHGVPPEKLKVIGNSTDTSALIDRVRRADPENLLRMRRSMQLSEGPTALFVGGLDRDKRIPFLLEAAKHAAGLDPRFSLVIAGRGADEDAVQRAQFECPAIHWIGSATVEQLADLSLLADCIWMPGRIGLIAVDAIALRLPVHTTDFPFHAPEVEFLAGGACARLPDAPGGFAAASLRLIRERPTIEWADTPSVDQVAARFVDVVRPYLYG